MDVLQVTNATQLNDLDVQERKHRDDLSAKQREHKEQLHQLRQEQADKLMDLEKSVALLMGDKQRLEQELVTINCTLDNVKSTKTRAYEDLAATTTRAFDDLKTSSTRRITELESQLADSQQQYSTYKTQTDNAKRVSEQRLVSLEESGSAQYDEITSLKRLMESQKSSADKIHQDLSRQLEDAAEDNERIKKRWGDEKKNLTKSITDLGELLRNSNSFPYLAYS